MKLTISVCCNFGFLKFADNVCIESLSIEISRFTLDSGTRSLLKLSERIDHIRKTDANKLHAEYQKLVDEVINRNIAKFSDEAFLRSPGINRHFLFLTFS